MSKKRGKPQLAFRKPQKITLEICGHTKFECQMDDTAKGGLTQF